MFSQGISIVIFIFQLLYILAVSAYPYFLKMPYRRVVVSVSAYPYPVSVQHQATSMERASNHAYEEYDPSIEWSRGAEADSVKIVLPGKRARD